MDMAQSSKKFILTPEGLTKLKGEYDQLVNVKRSQIIKRISKAREFGDLSENSEYDAAKDEQTLLELRITQLEDVLSKAKIITPVPKTEFVVIGSTIVVEVDGQMDAFTIVGTVEADPAKKKISNESPVGKAVVGLQVGETIEVALGPVKSKIKVLEIK